MQTIITSILLVLLVKGAQCLKVNETHVYVFAFMNITTDRPELAQYQEVFISSHLTTSFRMQLYHPNVPPIDLRDGHTDKRSHVELIFQGTDLSGQHTTATHQSAFRIASNGTLSIQGVKATRGSTDGFTAIPLTAESKLFFIPSYTHIPEGHSSFLIASAYPDTCVTVSRVENVGDKQVREAFFSLDEFETYQKYSDIRDFSGFMVESSRPVAVFGGHECAEVPKGVHFCDHLYEQVPPVSEWGLDSMTGPILGRSMTAKYHIRVFAAQVGTVVTLTGNEGTAGVVTINRGQWREFISKSVGEIIWINCNKPCMVSQYNSGQFAVANPPDVDTDPFMLITPPIGHWLAHYTFATARSWGSAGLALCDNYITVIGKTQDINGITLDDGVMTGSVTSGIGPGGAYSVKTRQIVHGNHSLDHPDPTVRFAAISYGHALSGDPNSYGYNLGWDVTGAPIPGNQWVELYSPTPAPIPSNCARPLPPLAVRAPNLVIVANLSLVTPVVDPCIVRYQNHINARLVNMKNQINYLICVGLMCKGTVFAQVVDIRIVEWLGLLTGRVTGVSLEISIANGIHETFREVLFCKKSIEEYVKARINWDMPADIAGCPILNLGPPTLAQKFHCNY